MTGAILGTPAYMAPEQAEGQPREIGRPSDVYALGAILYQLLVGRPPFRADSPLEVLDAIRSREPVAPSRLRPTVPRALETVCLKCLQKDPRHRYLEAGALSDDLRRFLDGRPIEARPVGPLRRLAMACRRNPMIAATVAAAVLVVFLTASLSIWRIVQERDRFRAERDTSQANLYRALLGEARGRIVPRETGWYWDALANLREASRIGARGDPNVPRELTIQCLGSEYGCFRRLAVVEAHSGGVAELVLSPDGRLAASGGLDGLVKLWNTDSHAPIATLSSHKGAITGLAFCFAGKRLASSGSDGTLRLWTLEDPVAPRELDTIDLGAGPIHDVQGSPDGQMVAAACNDGTVHIIAFRANGQNTGQRKVLRGHGGPVNCVAFSTSGRWLASGSEDQTIRFWHVASAQPSGTWLVAHPPSVLGYIPDHEGLVWCDRETFWVEARETVFPYQNARTVRGHDGPIRKFAFDTKGHLATASADGTLKLWNFSWRPESTLLAAAAGEPGASQATAVTVSHDGGRVVSGHGDGRIRFWETGESPRRVLFNPRSQSVAFSRGRVLASPDALRDFATGFNSPRMTRLGPGEITALVVRAGRRWFAIGRDDGTLEIWDVDTRRPVTQCTSHDGAITALAGSADGTLLASAARDGPVRVWEWQTGALVHALDAGSSEWQALAWRRDVNELAAAGEGGVCAWDFRAPTAPRPRLLVDRPQFRQLLTYGNGVFALLGERSTIEIRDARTGELRRALSDPDANVGRLEFAPDGRTLGVASSNAPIRLWDVEAGTKIAELEARNEGEPAETLDFSPDGRRLATSLNGALRIWDVASRRCLA